MSTNEEKLQRIIPFSKSDTLVMSDYLTVIPIMINNILQKYYSMYIVTKLSLPNNDFTINIINKCFKKARILMGVSIIPKIFIH